MPRPTLSDRLSVPVTITVLAALLSLAPIGAEAQMRLGAKGGVAFLMTVDDESYTDLKRSAGERGVSATDLGTWLGENVQIGVDAPADVRTTLALIAVDGGGTILYEGKVPLQSAPMKGDRIWLGQAGSASALSRVLDEFFSGRGFAPQGAPTPAFPADQGGETFVTVVNGYRRMAARAGARALSGQGLSRAGVALVLVAVPEPGNRSDPSLSIKMGGLVFVGMRPEPGPVR